MSRLLLGLAWLLGAVVILWLPIALAFRRRFAEALGRASRNRFIVLHASLLLSILVGAVMAASGVEA